MLGLGLGLTRIRGGSAPAPSFDPDALAKVGADSYWTDLTKPNTKYQDTLLTTAAGVGDPLGGVRNLSAVSLTPGLGQATTADKFEVDANGDALRITGSHSRHLALSNFTVNIAQGALFGWAFPSGIQANGVPIGGSSSCRVYRYSGSITLRYGSSSNIIFAADPAVLGAMRTLVVASGTGNRVYVYVDGVELGNQAHATSIVSQTGLIVGNSAPASNTNASFALRRFAALSTDGRVTDLSDFFAWLEAGL